VTVPAIPPQAWILNVDPSRQPERDWLLAHARTARVVSRKPLPAEVDLRETWWKVGDQGPTGSCVGWATGDGVLRWHFVKAGLLAQSTALSPRYLWMASKETDPDHDRPTTFIESAGTTIKAALDVARKYGVVRETTLPFAPGTLYGGDVKTFYATASMLRINGYYNLGTSPSDWRRWLADRGPVAARLVVDRVWRAAASTSGLLDSYDEDSADGGHAVTIVGYRSDGRLIVRNSWSTAWGDKGFGYMSESYVHDAFTEAYGVA
jgi:C1A family cysteine protease